MGINTQFPLIYFVISLSLTYSITHHKSATFSKIVQNVTFKIKSTTDRGKKYLIYTNEIGYSTLSFSVYNQINQIVKVLTYSLIIYSGIQYLIRYV